MNEKKNSAGALKELARKLLTTTCLTAVAVGAAQATTFVEGVDFNGTFGTANVLPAGTDRVQGAINPTGDNDYFQFTSLLGGSSYILSGLYEGLATYQLYNSAGTVLNGPTTNPLSFVGTVPGDGILVLGITQNEQVSFYDLTLEATSVPEPATAAGVGLALAGALALRRKLAK